MDDLYQPRRKKVSRVRQRYEDRQRRRDAMATPQSVYFASDDTGQQYQRLKAWRNRAVLLVRDAGWYITHTPVLIGTVAAIIGLWFLIFVARHVFEARIFPNVWSMGVYLGDLNEEEARSRLLDAWENEIQIQLVDLDRSWSASPVDMGILLDPEPIVKAARAVGMAGIPVGWEIDPVVTVDYLTAQNFMLDMAQKVELPPYNAGYQFQNGQVIGIAGREGRMMDVGLSMESLTENPIEITETMRMDLVMTPLPPDITDPEPFMELVRSIAAQPFQMIGYDPYLDKSMTWETTPDVLVSWMEATGSGLTVRRDTFAPFLEAQNLSLNQGVDGVRFLEPNETTEKIGNAMNNQASVVNLRIRYRPEQYEVGPGDYAYTIARKTGIPFYLVEQANTGRDLNTLSVGDKVNLPSRDVAVPIDPVPHKRVIVNLDTQSLVAYENGQEVFNWLISSGMSTAPTTPGIFQVLSHNETALGSSYTLCGTQGCGQWKMFWFMGIYEVVPGLMNGFHGAVLLPNGGYLGGGNVGEPYTFGCIMSLDANAQLLYEWADLGTVVEIISSEYPPQSELAQRAFPNAATEA